MLDNGTLVIVAIVVRSIFRRVIIVIVQVAKCTAQFRLWIVSQLLDLRSHLLLAIKKNEQCEASLGSKCVARSIE
jgi:hypothetical protein